MNLQTKRRAISVEEYHRMGEASIFSIGERIELIEGELFKMSPIGTKRANCLDYLNEIFLLNINKRALVRIQNPIIVSDYSEPEPDIVIAKRLNYRENHPTSKEIMLLIEVADSSYEFDRYTKLPIYAKTNVPEVWIININDNFVETFQEPQKDNYRKIKKISKRKISSVSFPDIVLELSSIFGDREV